MKKVLLMTIPHTGKVFLENYMTEVLELKKVIDFASFIETKDENVFASTHTASPQPLIQRRLYEYAKAECRVVATLRHPYANGVSCAARGHQNLTYAATNWRLMEQQIPQYDMFWVDVETAVENRQQMMLQLCKFLGRKPVKNERHNAFVQRWKKANALPKSNPIKKDFLNTGKLPEGYSFSTLDSAMKWYLPLKAKLDKQYAPASGSGPRSSKPSDEGSIPSRGAKQ